MNVLWFKRDLRLTDSAPLLAAAESGPFLPLHIIEPSLWRNEDASSRQYDFMVECLADLDSALNKRGANLTVKVGEALNIFKLLHAKVPVLKVYSFEETWNMRSYQRDLTLKEWFNKNNIEWVEFPRNGVVRRLSNRDGWSARFYAAVNQPILKSPHSIDTLTIESDHIPSSLALGVAQLDAPGRQKGGRHEALQALQSFLNDRGKAYYRELSSPNTAFESCSRLSPYLAFGCVSVKEVYQASEGVKKLKRYGWARSLNAFQSRLRWHCHFIQKLEDQPAIETQNLHSAYNAMAKKCNMDYLKAWKTGQTGYPFVDACMRALIHTGWINFRMRAMLVSFACYHLWLDWRDIAHYLAQLFVDYEPGIHYSQLQMQSGTTGINAIRIYNPIKQSVDQDPNGQFIQYWVPELKSCPLEFIHEPWKCGLLDSEYPGPIVDEKTARQKASAHIYAVRKSSDFKDEKQRILEKHASRAKRPRRKRQKNKSQLKLF